MSGRTGIFIALSGAVLYFVTSTGALRQCSTGQTAQEASEPVPKPPIFHLAVGFVTNFFDTLGIGSFATTTTIFKLGRVVRDKSIPGTMNVGHTLPTLLQAFLYITIIRVDLKTLVLLMASGVVGAWWGAGLVVRLPRRRIQLSIGGALTVSIFFLAMGNFAGSRLAGRIYALVDGSSRPA